MKLRVGITYNLKKDFSHQENQPVDLFEEFDIEETIDAIRDVLVRDGHEVINLGGDTGLIDRLKKASVDIVFNIAEGLVGRNREAHIPALLEFLNIPYTGSHPLTLSLTLDKAMAKRIVMSQNVSTPRFKKVERIEDLDGLDLCYPLFVKLCYEGSSKGVRLDSKVLDSQALEEKVRYNCPPPIDRDLLKRIEEVAVRAYRALECRDISRVDIRVGADRTPYFLEVNPLPGLSPVYGDLVIMARSMGWNYTRLVKTIFHQALKRYGWVEEFVQDETNRAKPL